MIVIGAQQDFTILFQVHADQQLAAGTHEPGDGCQQPGCLRVRKIADGRSRKEADAFGVFASFHSLNRKRFGEVGDHRPDGQVGKLPGEFSGGFDQVAA